jgi:DNA repair ATPase RecN
MASVKRGLGENKVDRDLDAVLDVLKSHRSEMSNHFDSLHSKPDKSNYIEESINAVKKAIGDHQKEVAGHFDKLHSSKATIDSVMGGLDKIERKVDLVREALPDIKMSQLEKIIKDHGVQENGVSRGMDEVKRAINDLKRQKLAWVSGS